MKSLSIRKPETVWVLRIIIILILLILLSAAGFFFFNLKSHGRQVLREAKNVNLALVGVEIEYYSRGEKIYDPSQKGNLSDGVKQAVKNISGADGEFYLNSFDNRKRKVLSLSYLKDGYYAVYTYDDIEGEKWTVSYLLPVINFSE